MGEVSLAPYGRTTDSLKRNPFSWAALLLIGTCLELLFIALSQQLIKGEPTEQTIALLLASMILYLIGLFLSVKLFDRIDPGRLSVFFTLATSLVFRLTLIATPPVWSEDLYRYRWEGQVQADGRNPYQIAPDATVTADFARIPSAHLPAGYGPLTELLEHTTALFSNDIRAFKIPGILGDLSCLVLLCWMLPAFGLPRERLLLYAWNPLVIFEFWAGGHNDSLALAGILGCLALFRSGKIGLGFVGLGLGIAAKWWPAILIPAFLGVATFRDWPKLILAAVPTLILLQPYGYDLLSNAKFLTGYAGGWRNSDFLHGPLAAIAGERIKLATAGLVAVIACYLPMERLLSNRRTQPASPLQSILLTITAILSLTSSLHPWYFTWLIPVLVLKPWPPLLLWTALAPILYEPVFAWHTLRVWNGVSDTRWLVHGPFAVLAVGYFIRDVYKRLRESA